MPELQRLENRSKAPRWWCWALKHPGALLLGGIVLAVLLAPRPWPEHPPAADRDADETPLFI